MTQGSRTLLNRILLVAIAIMTIAIFAIGSAMVYLFLNGGSDEEGDVVNPASDVNLGAVQEASNELGKALYRIPASCKAVVLEEEGELTVYLFQPGCIGSQVISSEGVGFEYPTELSE